MSTQEQTGVVDHDNQRTLLNWLCISLDSSLEAEERNRANTTILFAVCMMFWAILFSAIYVAMGSPRCALITTLAAIVCCGDIIYLKMRAPIWFCSNFLAAIVLVTLLMLSVFTGGFNAPAMIWLPAVPLIAILLLHWTVARWWFLATFVSAFVMLGLDLNSALPPSDFEGRTAELLYVLALLGIIACTSLLCFVFEYNTKILQRQMESSRLAAEAANRAKSDFLANMSHEIRTPMNAVIGMTELTLDSNLNQQQRDYLTIAHESAESLLWMINEILDFSKIEAGKLQLESLNFNLREAMEGALKPLRHKAHSQGLELNLNIDEQIPESLVGDSARLRQILMNLVSNAIKFTEQGKILVQVDFESIEDSRCRLTFRVADSGIGISQEHQEKIFSAFEQADSSTTRKYGGTGLGLAISAKLVGAMGGTIWLESSLGQGSTFFFSLEFAEGIVLPGDSQHSTDLLEHSKVVILDDKHDSHHILKASLQQAGADVYGVETANEALKTLQQFQSPRESPCILVSDVDRLGVGDVEWRTRLRSLSDLPSTSVILLTSQATARRSSEWKELGIFAQLTKPVTPSELFTVIVNASGERRASRSSVRTVPDAQADVQQALHVLLVEDGRANQVLAMNLLQKWGHRVTLASNGQQALDELDHHDFDLVLMDVQMPVMDGLEATRQIREREKQSGKRIPVIAMTARAMPGDRELCLEAGMDDYVTKPIRQHQLMKVLAEQTGICAAPDTITTTFPPDDSTDFLIDWKMARLNTGEDEGILHAVAQESRTEMESLLQQLQISLQQQDAQTLSRILHTMKSIAHTFGADSLCQLLQVCESEASQGNCDATREQESGLHVQTHRFLGEVNQFLDSASTS